MALRGCHWPLVSACLRLTCSIREVIGIIRLLGRESDDGQWSRESLAETEKGSAVEEVGQETQTRSGERGEDRSARRCCAKKRVNHIENDETSEKIMVERVGDTFHLTLKAKKMKDGTRKGR